MHRDLPHYLARGHGEAVLVVGSKQHCQIDTTVLTPNTNTAMVVGDSFPDPGVVFVFVEILQSTGKDIL